MVAKKKTTKHRIVAKKPPEYASAGQGPVALLAYIHARYDFGAALNTAVSNCLAEAVQAATPKVVDPLTTPPLFLVDDYDRPMGALRLSDHNPDQLQIVLGNVHGFEAFLYHYPHTRQTLLRVGCRKFWHEHDARSWWASNRNRRGEARPHATALIDYVASICKHRGWAW